MALGLILAILFTGPLAASTSSEPTRPGTEQIKEKTGPWVYRNASIHV